MQTSQMKKKVFFVLGNLRAGGSERVYWTLSQFLTKTKYDVSLIVLDSGDAFFSLDIKGVRVIQLNTIKASKSFFKLYRLIKSEKPHAIFTTGGHINTLLAAVTIFAPVPVLIGREASFVEIMEKFDGPVDRFLNLFMRLSYKRMNFGICQSEEIRNSLIKTYRIPEKKLVIIPNPVIPTETIKEAESRTEKKMIYVGRLSAEKGPYRLLDVFRILPENYTLTIAGSGPLLPDLVQKVREAGLQNRVSFLGPVSNVVNVIAKHDITVLTSFTEGFPNVAIESLSVGVPVVSFRVSGIAAIIDNGFNGFVVEQDDLDAFARQVMFACNKSWEAHAIKENVYSKFGVEKIAASYNKIISPQGEFSENDEAALIYS